DRADVGEAIVAGRRGAQAGPGALEAGGREGRHPAVGEGEEGGDPRRRGGGVEPGILLGRADEHPAVVARHEVAGALPEDVAEGGGRDGEETRLAPHTSEGL